MEDLMLHVVDLALNSVRAAARTVKISLLEAPREDRLCLLVADNGRGMTAELRQQVLEAYATTKRKRAGWKGLGIALVRGTVELVGGRFELLSRPGVGTLVRCELPWSHPDRPPVGDVAGCWRMLLTSFRDVDFVLTHRFEADGYRLDTRPVRREMGEAYLTRAVQQWLLEQARAGEERLAGGRSRQ